MASKQRSFGRKIGAALSLLALSCMLASYVSAFASGQAKGDERFVGTWKAQHQGKTFAVLKIKLENNKLVGTIALAAQVSVDKNGELDQVGGDLAADTPISDLKVNGSVLSFKHKDDDDDDKLELTLTSDKQADLKFIPTENFAGLKPPRPFKMTKDTK